MEEWERNRQKKTKLPTKNSQLIYYFLVNRTAILANPGLWKFPTINKTFDKPVSYFFENPLHK